MPDLRRPSSSPLSSPASSRARKRASAVEQRARRRRAITWGLSALLGALLVNAVVGDGGYLATVRASHEEAALAAEVTAIHLDNEDLIAQSTRLQQDGSAVEDVARGQMGMIKPGEVLVVIRDAVTAAPPSAK